MRHLLTLLHGGTHGTLVEPNRTHPARRPNGEEDQRASKSGTLGTHGTLEIERSEKFGDKRQADQAIADLVDLWNERSAIALEAGDIGEAEAHRIAEAEVGASFARIFTDRVETHV